LGSGTTTGNRSLDEAALPQVPQEARPAAAYLLQNPDDVGLVAYEVGRETEAITLNADAPLPLASVVKVIHLLAYAEAVQVGVLAPESPVPLAEIERYYLPNSDLGAHPQSVAALREEERVSEAPPSVALEDVPRMMTELSSNAATDYLHMLLGQERIEQTALSLGLTQQTAPCPFLGQFLLMANGNGNAPSIQTLLNEPQTYSRDVMRLTTAYSTDRAFRQEADGWFSRGQRPSLSTQRLFS
jgi:beta-lactamase class A